MMQAFRAAVRQAEIPCYDITYEDLFDGRRSLNNEEMSSMLLLLSGYASMPESASEHLDILLDPCHGKLNSDDISIGAKHEEIARTFGNDETGWLF
jgi:hypothetical protein